MTDEQLAQWQAAIQHLTEAAQDAWEIIQQWARRVMAAVRRWYRSLPASLRYAMIGDQRPATKKIRRYARMVR